MSFLFFEAGFHGVQAGLELCNQGWPWTPEPSTTQTQKPETCPTSFICILQFALLSIIGSRETVVQDPLFLSFLLSFLFSWAYVLCVWVCECVHASASVVPLRSLLFGDRFFMGPGPANLEEPPVFASPVQGLKACPSGSILNLDTRIVWGLHTCMAGTSLTDLSLHPVFFPSLTIFLSPLSFICTPFSPPFLPSNLPYSWKLAFIPPHPASAS